jgi:hypothetical protein
MKKTEYLAMRIYEVVKNVLQLKKEWSQLNDATRKSFLAYAEDVLKHLEEMEE